jgi:hypothetical protein
MFREHRKAVTSNGNDKSTSLGGVHMERPITSSSTRMTQNSNCRLQDETMD